MDARSIEERESDSDGELIDVFAQVDRLLNSAEDMILTSRSHSPFNPYLTRLPEHQARLISNGIADIRTSMMCALRELHEVPLPQPHLNLVPELRAVLANASRVISQVPDSTSPKRLDVLMARSQGVAHENLIAHIKEVFDELDRFLLCCLIHGDMEMNNKRNLIMKMNNRCAKCSSTDLLQIPPVPGDGPHIAVEHESGLEMVGVARFVCANCGYIEQWVHDLSELTEIRREYGSGRSD